MNNLQAFKAFENGSLRLSQGEKSFIDIPWSQHPAFEGVELKHILTANDTNCIFSFHLVRIAPNKSIKNHIHETQLETHEVVSGSGICVNNGQVLNYEEGVISFFPAGIHHEVTANNEGLCLFAKFIPALC